MYPSPEQQEHTHFTQQIKSGQSDGSPVSAELAEIIQSRLNESLHPSTDTERPRVTETGPQQEPVTMPTQHKGTFMCLDCPDPRNDPPYRILTFRVYMRDHLRKYPAHHQSFYCQTCGRFHPLTMFPRYAELGQQMRLTWGGRRPRAGAPKGNLNALKHGKRSKDGRLREYLGSIPPETLPRALNFVKKWKGGQ